MIKGPPRPHGRKGSKDAPTSLSECAGHVVSVSVATVVRCNVSGVCFCCNCCLYCCCVWVAASAVGLCCGVRRSDDVIGVVTSVVSVVARVIKTSF